MIFYGVACQDLACLRRAWLDEAARGVAEQSVA